VPGAPLQNAFAADLTLNDQLFYQAILMVFVTEGAVQHPQLP
jgi:hypothetical protein